MSNETKQAVEIAAATMANLESPQAKREYVARLEGIKIGAELSAADKKEES